MTLHAGYARSVSGEPLDETAAQVGGTGRVQRDDVLDAGPQWRAGDLTLGLDGYIRRTRNLFATSYRADAPIGDAFSFAHAWAIGAEALATYTEGPVSAWANLAVARTTATGISSGHAVLDPATLVYLATHRAPIDSDQRVTASGGASVRLDEILLSSDVVAERDATDDVGGLAQRRTQPRLCHRRRGAGLACPHDQ